MERKSTSGYRRYLTAMTHGTRIVHPRAIPYWLRDEDNEALTLSIVGLALTAAAALAMAIAFSVF